jgi:hypothetical protein
VVVPEAWPRDGAFTAGYRWDERSGADVLGVVDAARRHSAGGATLFGVTIREKVEKLLDRLSEPELEAEYERLQRAVAGEGVVDEWGDLDKFSARASLGVLRHMTEDEEKAGLSWEEFRPQ